jgi:putative ABC transport system permease protein
VLPGTEHATVIGELTEEFLEEIHPHYGAFRSAAWFWREGLSLVGAYLWATLRRGRSRDFSVILDAHRYRRRSRMFGPSHERSGRLESLLQDIRQGTRSLVKRPAFTVAALLTIAVGIGANTTIYPMLHATTVRPLPFEDPGRLVLLYETLPEYGRGSRTGVSPPNFADWDEQNRVLDGLAAYTARDISLLGSGDPERLDMALVSHDLFTVLGINPVLGRSFLPEEDRPGQEGTVILSHALWQRRFGGNPELVGNSINLDGENHRVVGVAPPGFRFPDTTELWIPLRDEANLGRGAHMLWCIGRLREGVSRNEARIDLQAIEDRIVEQYPEDGEGLQVGIMSLHAALFGELNGPLAFFYGVVCLVLLLACANTANLMLALFSTRRSEIAIRSSLGASRGRITRQLLTESIMLALAGGAIGLVIGQAARSVLLANVPIQLPYHVSFETDLSIYLAIVVIVLLSGILFGTAPAWGSARPNLVEALGWGNPRTTGGIRQSRLRKTLLVFQVTLAVVVLVTSGLLIRSYVAFQSVDIGIDPENVLTARVALPETAYPEDQSRRQFYLAVTDRLRSHPAVVSASTIQSMPLGSSRWARGYTVEGQEADPDGSPQITYFRVVQSGFFTSLGLSIVRGRDFTDQEARGPSAPVIIVNQAFAEQHWPGEDPIGKRVKWGRPSSEQEWIDVIGVAENINTREPGGRMEACCYVPLATEASDEMFLVARTMGDPLDLVEEVKAAVWTIDADLPVYQIQTLEDFLWELYWPATIGAWAMIVFSTIALVLAAVGIYGIIAYSVSQRTREVGIRIALGARRSDVVAMVTRQITGLTGLGILLGLGLAFGLVQALAALLYGVIASDPFTYLIVAAVMAGVAFLASYIPARRAARVDPMEAVRYE